ncbi:chaplin family protein [Cryobacterium sp. PH31-L1]|uniref:chaplin family protein n=1 Tax=Cryobacterium sp. PH31-L1 TaxID=3046199 RepID=UPI0024BA45EB|nr:chaplin family protein [Cryobacterium sp. PH31-L1]MDJ0377574.1 chaplin family protein [Cryobacterium sp. PH31-L1]
MNTFLKKGLYCALLVGGLSLIGISAANAAEAPSTTGADADGIVSGSQVVTDLVAPITLTGNAISVLGDSSAGQSSPTTPATTDAAAAGLAPTTSGADGVASGTQAVLATDAPVTVSGNAISVLGDSSSTGSDTTPVPATQPAASTANPTTTGTNSLLGATQVVTVVTAPIVADGNAISVIGDSSSTGESTAPTNGASTTTQAPTTTGSNSRLGGTQFLANLSMPVTAQNNAISVAGDSDSEGATNASSNPGWATGSTSPTTTGTDSFLGGSQAVPLVALPISVSDNAVSLVGDSSAIAPTEASPTSTTGTQPVMLVGTNSYTRSTGNSSLAALRLTPLFGSTLANSTLATTGTKPLPFLAVGLLLAMAGLGLAGRSLVARSLIIAA